MKFWDGDRDEFSIKKLKKRLCTFGDIEDETSYGFIPHSDPYIVENFKRRVSDGTIWCIEEDYKLHGDYDSKYFANLMVVFDKCNETQSNHCLAGE